MNYRDTEIWRLARALAVDIHRMSLTKLPKFEMFEEGSQIRRSSKSIRSNIVEGYGRRRYKAEFIKFLVYAHASCDETIDHLEAIFETGSLTDEPLYQQLRERLDVLGRKLNRFIQSVEQEHLTPAPVTPPRRSSVRIANPESRIPNRS
jgi:four helix bundle protein